jgi:hypothetical protein
MIDPIHLDHHHRSTAEAILSHPVSHNIEWRDVLSLLEAIGEVTEEHDGKFKVAVGGEIETLHRPGGKDLDEHRRWAAPTARRDRTVGLGGAR